jgi:type VI secretion system Hcp family effector
MKTAGVLGKEDQRDRGHFTWEYIVFTKSNSGSTIMAAFMGMVVLGGAALARGGELMGLQITGVPGDTAFANANTLPLNSIEVLSVAFGTSNAGSGVNSHPNLQNLSVAKYFGDSTPNLFIGSLSATVYPTATVTFYRFLQSGLLERYYTITMTNVTVTSLAMTDLEGAASNSEQVTFGYQQITVRDLVTGTHSCWNVVTGTSC